MAYVIVEPCIGEKNASCVDVCPVSCIYEAEDIYYINPDECIECGACEPERPVNAIFHEGAVPEEWQSYTQKNREIAAFTRSRRSNCPELGCERAWPLTASRT